MIFRLFALAASIVLVGCVTGIQRVDHSDQTALQEHIQRLSAIDRWDLRAKLAFRTGNKGGSGTLVWKRIGNQHNIELFGSFGDNRIRIIQNSNGAILTDSKGEVFAGRSADELLYRRTGWTLPPIHEFDDWVLCSLSLDSATDKNWSESGYVTAFEQSGWKVLCFNYQDVGRYKLPKQVRIASSDYDPIYDRDIDQTDGPKELRLAIYSWGIE